MKERRQSLRRVSSAAGLPPLLKTPHTLHPREGCTVPPPLPGRTLDFIYLPPGARGARSHVVRSFLSDHRPVVVDFEGA